MVEIEQETLGQSVPAQEYRPSPPQLQAYRWQPGFCPNTKGRPRGSRAISVIERYEKAIAKKYVERSLNDKARDQGEMLRHAVNKFVPDAGKDASPSSAGVHVVVFVGDGSTPRTIELAQNPSNVTP